MKYDVSKYVGSKIREFRKLRKMTQKELGDKIGVKHNTVSSYESGTNEVEQDTLFKISQVLDISINDLFPPIASMDDYRQRKTNADTVKELQSNLIRPNPATVKIPILGTIACGEAINAEENFKGYRYESPEMLPSGTLYYLETQGDSMEPTIPDNAYVMIREQPEVEYGEIAAVLVNGNTEATLKRVKKQDGMVILMPDNPAHEPYIITEDNPARIIGKAIRYVKDL